MATLRKRGKRWQAIVRKAGHEPLQKSFATKSEAATWAKRQEAIIEQIKAEHDPLQKHFATKAEAPTWAKALEVIIEQIKAVQDDNSHAASTTFCDEHGEIRFADVMDFPDFVERYPQVWRNIHAARNAVRNRETNGLDACGAIKKVGQKRLVVIVPRVFEWLINHSGKK